MSDKYTTRIETVIVEVRGTTIDCISFTSANQAEAYKRGVRNWAAKRGVCARVSSRVLEVTRKEPTQAPATTPALSFAI